MEYMNMEDLKKYLKNNKVIFFNFIFLYNTIICITKLN